MCEILLAAKHSVLRFIPPPFRRRHDLASLHAPNIVCSVSIQVTPKTQTHYLTDASTYFRRLGKAWIATSTNGACQAATR